MDSRSVGDSNTIRRRRECCRCSFRFSTQEEVVIWDITVIKKDERREPYNRLKVIHGLEKALEKRPVNCFDLKHLVSAIEIEIQKKRKSEISSMEIGQIVAERLRSFDKVAYIRFASVYKQFDDLSHFIEELNQIKDGDL